MQEIFRHDAFKSAPAKIATPSAKIPSPSAKSAPSTKRMDFTRKRKRNPVGHKVHRNMAKNLKERL